MPQPLNRHLRKMTDGAVATNVVLAWVDGSRQQNGRIYVYWPFFVFKNVYGEWNVTHALTGYNATYERTRKAAVAFIVRLRTVADWDFRSPKGVKAKVAKGNAKKAGLIQRVSIAT